MRIKKKYICKDGGYVIMTPLDDEDIYHIYNLIGIGDLIEAFTTRKIVNKSQTGVTKTQKRKIKLTLKIIKIQYYTNANSHLALEIKGTNVKKNEFMSLG